MNKLLKGSIAGAAGIALLLGGAGTFALWNDSENISSSNISTGELGIDLSGAGTWQDVSSDVTPATISPATFRMVPGDKVRFEQNVTIKASGKNLKAELAFAPGANAIPASLSSATTVTVGAAIVGTGNATVVSQGAGTNKFTITPTTAGDTTVKVTIDIELSKTGLTGANGQNATINLAAANFALTQVRP
ncbi:alternate-type signal peptide domain-containing protein [Homoserinibacter sp. YIM 151385]|uniref:alternate-type signal peptide domain-containing protein n=1 Tax=Homoserinibacter sp. YIM 151385 TaxID=2985506 RepID=UPI0022F03367|nr:alternate-type signal peptide domain-containing protein [Homoserinibacter sp. YIM 151385]WBU39148.1 alternate-type signal peptide domain-containing protein [Homoserinibacter sp. YIM 151385]